MLRVLIFGYLALTVYGASTAAPDCSKDINDAATCFMDMMKDAAKKMNDTYNSHKADIDTCLKSAGCEFKDDPKKDQKKKCFQQVVPKVKSSIETCLKSSKHPNLTLPDIKFDFDNMPVDPLKILNQSCPNPDATKNAFECIGKLFNTSQAFNAGQAKAQMDKAKQFFETEVEKNCTSKMSESCKDIIKDIKKCGMKAQCEIKKLTADIAECKGVDLGEKSGEKSDGKEKSDEKNGNMEKMCEMINKGASDDAHKPHEMPMKPAKENDAGTQKPRNVSPANHHGHH